MIWWKILKRGVFWETQQLLTQCVFDGNAGLRLGQWYWGVSAWGVLLNRQCRPVCVFVCLCVCWAWMHSKEHVWVWRTLARQTFLHSTHAKKTRTFQPLLDLGRYAFVYFGDPFLFKTYFRNHKLIFFSPQNLWHEDTAAQARIAFLFLISCTVRIAL